MTKCIFFATLIFKFNTVFICSAIISDYYTEISSEIRSYREIFDRNLLFFRQTTVSLAAIVVNTVCQYASQQTRRV